jgi:hypothetical protein
MQAWSIRSLIVLVLPLVTTRALAQAADTLRLKPAARLSEASEISLARTAAPVSIADRASIWVLGDSGYRKAVAGSNGFGCIVQRGTSGQSLIPRCDDANGVETLYPGFVLLEEMRAKGALVREYRGALAEAYRSGRLRAPRWGGFSYMYSTDAVFVTADGRRIPFTPHVMIYWPNCALGDLGMTKSEDMRGTGLALLDLGTPECHLIINTPPETARSSSR